MTRESSLQDIQDIKNMMSKSSKFNSISGFSGIFAGFYLLIAAIVYQYLLHHQLWLDFQILDYDYHLTTIICILFVVFVLSFITLFLLTSRKAKRNSETIWNASFKRMSINFLIPSLAGGLFIILTLGKLDISLSSSLMLIFYGVTLVNGSKYTLGDIRGLGILEIILGLINVVLPEYSFWIFTLGFGLMNIIYGLILHFKYDKE